LHIFLTDRHMQQYTWWWVLGFLEWWFMGTCQRMWFWEFSIQSQSQEVDSVKRKCILGQDYHHTVVFFRSRQPQLRKWLRLV